MSKHVNYHALSVDAICQNFGVEKDHGLTQSEAQERLDKFGPNRIGEAAIKSNFEILLDQFKSLLTALLIAAAVLSFYFSEHAEGFAIIIVVLLNTTIGFWAESKAIKSIAALKKIGGAKTKVLREDYIYLISAENIVPGDIILLKAGDIVSADVRILTSTNLQADESLLTGESAPVDKQNKLLAQDTETYHLSNMLFKGTTVTRGSSKCLVVGTGRHTELGEIADLTHKAKSVSSPLEVRLKKLSEQLLIAVLVLMVLLTAIGIFTGRESVLVIKTAIALSIAAIPEGLPVVATLALARGMWKLAERNALIERLSAVETLGSVTVIFTDKTGTLTENRMTAQKLITPSDPERNSLENPVKRDDRAFRVCALCYSGEDPDSLSDPTEKAIIEAAQNVGRGQQVNEKGVTLIKEEAFDPNIRMMAKVYKLEDEQFLYVVKGAPGAILTSCTRIAMKDGDTEISDTDRDTWKGQTEKFASKGLRVLALAEKCHTSAEEKPYTELIFLGLICLEDPPREDAAQAVQSAHDAGVRVIMATGDNAVTGKSIAEAVGIGYASSSKSLEGHQIKQIDQLTTAEKDELESISVFARVNPHQKLDLIELYQQKGHVVAMTGDGVNDAPALKKADVGISMGVKGTEAAKEAAEMILKDDSFASIVVAIQQGRIIFANIRKFVIYLLSCNLSEILVITLGMISGLPLPLFPLQILFLNFITDVFPALALGFGEGDKEILNRPPRQKQEGIIGPRHWYAIMSYALLMTVSVMGAFIWALYQEDKPDHYPQTIAFLTMALGQLWNVFNMRSRASGLIENQIVQNPFVWMALALCMVIIGVALYTPIIATTLHILIPDITGWGVIIAASFVPLYLGQVGKAFSRKESV